MLRTISAENNNAPVSDIEYISEELITQYLHDPKKYYVNKVSFLNHSNDLEIISGEIIAIRHFFYMRNDQAKIQVNDDSWTYFRGHHKTRRVSSFDLLINFLSALASRNQDQIGKIYNNNLRLMDILSRLTEKNQIDILNKVLKSKSGNQTAPFMEAYLKSINNITVLQSCLAHESMSKKKILLLKRLKELDPQNTSEYDNNILALGGSLSEETSKKRKRKHDKNQDVLRSVLLLNFHDTKKNPQAIKEISDRLQTDIKFLTALRGGGVSEIHISDERLLKNFKVAVFLKDSHIINCIWKNNLRLFKLIMLGNYDISELVMCVLETVTVESLDSFRKDFFTKIFNIPLLHHLISMIKDRTQTAILESRLLVLETLVEERRKEEEKHSDINELLNAGEPPSIYASSIPLFPQAHTTHSSLAVLPFIDSLQTRIMSPQPHTSLPKEYSHPSPSLIQFSHSHNATPTDEGRPSTPDGMLRPITPARMLKPIAPTITPKPVRPVTMTHPDTPTEKDLDNFWQSRYRS